MTSRQRLLAAFQRRPTDRLPVQVRGVRVWDERWVTTRDPSYAPVIEAVRAHGDLEVGWSPAVPALLTAHPMGQPETRVEPGAGDWDQRIATLRTPRGDLTSIHQVSRRGLPGMTSRFYAQSLEQLEWVREIPYEPVRPPVEGFFRLREQVGERGLILVNLTPAVGVVQALLGTEAFALAMMDAPDEVLSLLWLFQQRVEDLARYLLEQGVGPLFGDVGAEYAGPPVMSPRFFRALYAEPEARTAALLHAQGALLHIHCHGAVRQLLPDFIAIGADVLHPLEAPPMGDTPLAEAKESLAGTVCIEGNIQIGDVYSLPPPEFERVVHDAVAVGAPGGGFVLCPTASPYTPELPPTAVANYLTLVRLGREYRYTG
jgi:uroporphyrinogen-III decarboxylase